MPRAPLGQQITFAMETDTDRHYRGSIWIDVKVGDTIRAIAARRGHPEEASSIAKLNKVRSTRTVLRHRPHRKHDKHRIKVPAQMRASERFHVLAGDDPPRIVEGYAQFDTVDRPQRTSTLERDIALLERMAGRGNFAGAAVGPPPVIRLSVTDNSGKIVPLIPVNYQWSSDNAHAPVWRITAIDWDTHPERNTYGNRIRQKATVTVKQHMVSKAATRSATARNRSKKK
jgi:hypothetical protein